jgi:RNA polymerase sigma-70 factor (ECF subfamily)
VVTLLPRARDTETDDALAAQAAGGDNAAFGELYRRYAARVLGFIRVRAAVQDEAEDLTQVVFLKAWKAMPRFRPGEAPFFAWLLVIAANTVVSAHRRRSRAMTAPLPDSGVGDRHSDAWEEATAARLDTEAWLRTALPRLGLLQRRVLFLRFVIGLDHAEVARRVGRSSTAVRVIQHRALNVLRSMNNPDTAFSAAS